MSQIKPRSMPPPKPERPPARGTPGWYALKREQSNARAALRERKRAADPARERWEQEKMLHVAYRSGNSRLRPFSNEPKAVARQSEYRRVKEEWRAERIAKDGYLRCEWHDGAGHRCERRANKSPHHKAGRIGANLCDKRKFMAICTGPTGHHNWIHFQEPEEAAKRGFIIREYQQH